MRETYENLRELANLYRGTEALEELALNYQNTEDPIILAYVFTKQYGLIYGVCQKYFYLNESDFASFSVEEVHKVLMKFDPNAEKVASVRTMIVRYLERRLYKETKELNYQKRSANNTADSYEVFVTEQQTSSKAMSYKEDKFEMVELIDLVNKVDSLTDNEIKYCKIIMQSGDKVKATDIAQELGISSSAVTQIKKSLQGKLSFMVA
jgi:RNA polymerase sigma factor (sigma-70 family)